MFRDASGRFKGAGILRKLTHYVVVVLVVYLASMYAITLLTDVIYSYLYGSLFLKWILLY